MAEEKEPTFQELFTSLSPQELTWLFGMAADQATESMERAETNHLRHKGMGREKEASEALDRMEFYKKVIQLRHAFMSVRSRMEAPMVLASLGYRPKAPPRKKV